MLQDAFNGDDLIRELGSVPPRVLAAFNEGLSAHREGRLNIANSCYFALHIDGVLLSVTSAVVAYNIHLVYEDAGPDYMYESDWYLHRYWDLLETGEFAP